MSNNSSLFRLGRPSPDLPILCDQCATLAGVSESAWHTTRQARHSVKHRVKHRALRTIPCGLSCTLCRLRFGCDVDRSRLHAV